MMQAAINKSWLSKQAWIDAPFTDLLLIISPAFIVTGFVLAFQQVFTQSTQIPLWVWVVLIVGIDVAHVYATLFRTYLNPVEFEAKRTLFTWVPLVCWIMGALLYALDEMLFWHALAYLAVFHFIRQQYGFMMIYARKESNAFRSWRWLDTGLIYLAMLYPLAYWHVHLPRNFNWFIESDFLRGLPSGTDSLVGITFLLALFIYLFKECLLSFQLKQFNLPKNLLILGTTFSWYVGIVLFNGDLAFTATNVISHGVPYMALIWLQGRRNANNSKLSSEPFLNTKQVFSKAWLPLFIVLLWLCAWFEEGLWDGFIWREHLGFFTVFSKLPVVTDSVILAWLIPLLALPQSTHYVLDGFIWRMKGNNIFEQEMRIVTNT